MNTVDLSNLQPGHSVFVDIWGVIYPGVVKEQQAYDETVRVTTEAAKVIHHAWKSMSFRWKTGVGYANCGAKILVPLTEEEHTQLSHQVKVTQNRFMQELGLDLPAPSA